MQRTCLTGKLKMNADLDVSTHFSKAFIITIYNCIDTLYLSLFYNPNQNKMTATKSAFFVIAVSCLLTACLTPQKIDKWTTAQYGTTVQSKIRTNDYISIKVPGTSNDFVSSTVKRKMKLIPALLYWHWEYGTTTTLNSLIPSNYFSTAIIPYANSKKLKDKLNGQKLEITINKMPAVFSVVDKGGLVFLVVYYIDWDRFYGSAKTGHGAYVSFIERWNGNKKWNDHRCRS